jgi:hypothetical protein
MPVDDFAEQDGATVPQLRYEVTELMPGISHGNRLRRIRHALARQNLQPFRTGEPNRIKAQFQREFSVQTD